MNLGLQVLGKRNDGYHELHTIFQELEFHDTVHMSISDQGCEISSTGPAFPLDDSNTCKKAYTAVCSHYSIDQGIKVNIEKHIPQRSGLGGGSSNGAAVIKGMNKLFDLALAANEMETLAAPVGADGPFFIKGRTQLGEGIGSKLTPIHHLQNYTFLLITPPVSISTIWAYSALKKDLQNKVKKAKFADLLRRDPLPFELFKNDFERIVIPAHPEIGQIKDSLLMNGARYASLSGSGSTVFGMFDEEAAARVAESVFPSDYRTIITSPIHS